MTTPSEGSPKKTSWRSLLGNGILGAAVTFLLPWIFYFPRLWLEISTVKQRTVWTLLNAAAEDDEERRYPDVAGDSNSNFRILFQSRLADEEKWFVFPIDIWFAKGSPDEIIGEELVFAKALEPGELSITYVAGLTLDSRPDLPIMISGAGRETAWITGLDKVRSDHFFKTTVDVVVTFVDGTSKTMTTDDDGKLRQLKDGKMMDIFSVEYGTDPTKIRLPAPLPTTTLRPE